MRLAEQSREFLDYVEKWLQQRPAANLAELLDGAGGPAQAAIFCVDLINGFCTAGPLASPRVGAIVAPIRRLFDVAHAQGVRRFILPQDNHPADSPEFADFGPHCVVGTEEAETVAELQALPFAAEFTIVPKRSIASQIGTALPDLIARDGLPPLAITVGDCTDLCVYQLAMWLKLTANATGAPCRVVVPTDCVDTYDLPLAAAQQLGATPHDGDLLHAVFLYHLGLNGVEVVARVE